VPYSVHFCEYLTAFREQLKTFYFQAAFSNAPSHPLQRFRLNSSFWVLYKFVCLVTYLLYVHRVSKKQSKLFSSELRQISTNFDNFWQKDGAISQWRHHHSACVRAHEAHFEHKF